MCCEWAVIEIVMEQLISFQMSYLYGWHDTRYQTSVFATRDAKIEILRCKPGGCRSTAISGKGLLAVCGFSKAANSASRRIVGRTNGLQCKECSKVVSPWLIGFFSFSFQTGRVDFPGWNKMSHCQSDCRSLLHHILSFALSSRPGHSIIDILPVYSEQHTVKLPFSICCLLHEVEYNSPRVRNINFSYVIPIPGTGNRTSKRI